MPGHSRSLLDNEALALERERAKAVPKSKVPDPGLADPSGDTRAPAHHLGLLRRLIYGFYEGRLSKEVVRGRVPRHLAIILDGNRRFARTNRISDPRTIYATGAQKLDEVLDWCHELGVSAVTLWVCSTDNLNRGTEELAAIHSAIADKITDLATDPKVHERGICVRAAGRLELLPDPVMQAIKLAESATREYRAMTLTIAVAYGGREEIVDALRSLLEECAGRRMAMEEIIAHISPLAVGRHLYSADLPDPDLIIRTSGELRLSGFLLWQSAYSEFYFTDVNWPAFRKIDFLRAIRAYQQRQRRYGL